MSGNGHHNRNNGKHTSTFIEKSQNKIDRHDYDDREFDTSIF